MNVRNSINNKISEVVDTLKVLREQRIITNDTVDIKIKFDAEVFSDDSASASFIVSCLLDR